MEINLILIEGSCMEINLFLIDYMEMKVVLIEGICMKIKVV